MVDFNDDSLIGLKINRWTVLGYSSKVKPNCRVNYYKCVCECGTIRNIHRNSLKDRKTKSCGCLKKEIYNPRGFKHGGVYKDYNKRIKNPEYITWTLMKQRCYNPNASYYEDYGGRGIIVCERWLESFNNFLEDMGERPLPKEKYSINRINNDGNYEKSNCEWTIEEEQQKNRRKRRYWKRS